MASDEAAFALSMQIGNNSSATRVRPHIGIWVENLRTRFMCDAASTAAIVERFQDTNKGSLLSQLTKTEQLVLLNFVVHMRAACCDIVMSYIKVKGMVK